MKRLNNRPQSIWYNPGGSDMPWQISVNERTCNERLERKFFLIVKDKTF